MLTLAFLGLSEIHLEGDALEKIKSDPAFLAFRAEIYNAITSNPDYMNSDFDFSYERQVKFGGPRDPASMLMQLLDPNNPKYSETMAVGGNELSWMLRAAYMYADVQVTRKGQVTISYSVYDEFDLKPQQGRSLAYNLITHILGSVWHNALGASGPEIYATWTETCCTITLP